MAAADQERASAGLDSSDRTAEAERLGAFYARHPYPRPETDLDAYRDGEAAILGSPDRFGRLLFPAGRPRAPLHILIAGCGTSQAAKYALLNPSAHVTGIDVSELSVAHTRDLQDRYSLRNLRVEQLALHRVGELQSQFDLIVATGVLHHQRDPSAGLAALTSVLKPSGVMHIMVYAQYGRTGVYMLQEYARLLGMGINDQDVEELGAVLETLGRDHPAHIFGRRSDDFRYPAGIADALLHPQDRAYTVPQLMAWLESASLQFGRWLLQAPYRSACSTALPPEHRARLAARSEVDDFAAMELWRGDRITHEFLCAHRAAHLSWEFDDAVKASAVPRAVRFPGARTNQIGLPPGSAAQLWHPAHRAQDLLMDVDADDKQLVDSLEEAQRISTLNHPKGKQDGLALLHRLWLADQVMIGA